MYCKFLLSMCYLLLLFHICHGTASQCRGPSSHATSNYKRGLVAVLSNDEPSPDTSQSSTTSTNTTQSTYPISPEARYYIDKQPSTYYITGPLNKKLAKRSKTFKGSISQELKPTKCVACRMDCMAKVNPEVGEFFESCRERYYYYGCKKKRPCYAMADGDFVVEMAIGICLEKNGCIMKSSFLSNNNQDDEDEEE